MLKLSHIARYALCKNFLKKPIYLIFFITNRCNSRCRHCFYWGNLNHHTTELSLDKINTVSMGMDKLIWLALSGGEPFLREDIVDIVDIFYKNNKVENVAIPTNGLLPAKIFDKTKQLLNSEFDGYLCIELSVDGTEELHDYIRGVKGGFNRVVDTYNRLEKLLPTHPNFAVKINTTVSNVNIGHLCEIGSVVRERMPLASFHGFEIIRGTPKEPEFKVPTIPELKSAKRVIYSIWDEYEFDSTSRLKSYLALNTKKYVYDMGVKTLERQKPQIPCVAGRVHCVLDYNGDVFLCELLEKVGNIRENSFDIVWNSTRANKMRDSIKRGECYCAHSGFQNTNVLLNPLTYPKLLRG